MATYMVLVLVSDILTPVDVAVLITSDKFYSPSLFSALCLLSSILLSYYISSYFGFSFFLCCVQTTQEKDSDEELPLISGKA
mmetsp:Transcript_49119/g.101410  ORF Transcript_49119/g.101410 Transcript_49119/m.101410 type:complete len:82 (+) Transcript_49119:186-431(+)